MLIIAELKKKYTFPMKSVVLSIYFIILCQLNESLKAVNTYLAIAV